MSVSWHQAPSPLYPAQANLKREKERARGNKKRTAGEWRRLGVGKGMNGNVSWRFADSEEVPFWKIATGPLGRFCPAGVLVCG